MPSRPLPLLAALLLLSGCSLFRGSSSDYNPRNTASPSGYTQGYELNRNIGCAGQDMFGQPCQPMPPATGIALRPSMGIDSDGDGVPDVQDRCPGTLPGRPVNNLGCELDSDGDGVVDFWDYCPGTPPGRRVDFRGCDQDSDGDGVLDYWDQCPGTPHGRPVDNRGCELRRDLDSDGDGVADAWDRCPLTPPGTRVDTYGCPPQVSQPTYPAPYQGGQQFAPALPSLPLPGVNFNNNSVAIRSEDSGRLEQVVATLLRYPGLRVEIAGHTDNRHSRSYNQRLSLLRAHSVQNYLISRGIPAASLSAVGYGETRPIADNATEAGRFMNRRVELHVLY